MTWQWLLLHTLNLNITIISQSPSSVSLIPSCCYFQGGSVLRFKGIVNNMICNSWFCYYTLDYCSAWIIPAFPTYVFRGQRPFEIQTNKQTKWNVKSRTDILVGKGRNLSDERELMTELHHLFYNLQDWVVWPKSHNSVEGNG